MTSSSRRLDGLTCHTQATERRIPAARAKTTTRLHFHLAAANLYPGPFYCADWPACFCLGETLIIIGRLLLSSPSFAMTIANWTTPSPNDSLFTLAHLKRLE